MGGENRVYNIPVGEARFELSFKEKKKRRANAPWCDRETNWIIEHTYVPE